MLSTGGVVIIRWRQKVDGKEHEKAKVQIGAKVRHRSMHWRREGDGP